MIQPDQNKYCDQAVRFYSSNTSNTMETLAMKFFTSVHNSVAKVSSSISIGLLTLGIITGTVACHREDAATLQQGSEPLASNPVLSKAEPIEPESPNSTSPASRALPAEPQTKKEQPVVEQEEGQLRLINDTPYTSVVSIYDSAGESYRYAYVPPCSTRELYDTYSNSRLIRLNDGATFPISQKAAQKDIFFTVKMSALSDASEQDQLCKFKPYEASNVGLGGLASLGPKVVKPAAKGGGQTAAKTTAKVAVKTAVEVQPYSKALLNKSDKVREVANKATLVDQTTMLNVFKPFTDEAKKEVELLRYKEDTVKVGEIVAYTQRAADTLAMRTFGAKDDHQALKNLISHARLEFEAGRITNVEELKNFLGERIDDPRCFRLYSMFLQSLNDKTVKSTFDIFKQAKQVSDARISNAAPSQVAQIKYEPSQIKNAQVQAALEANPGCSSKKDNHSAVISISDHSRPQVEKVLQ